MSNDTLFMTRTMARIQEDQGQWEKAAEIYRHLLKQTPDDNDLQTELARAEAHLEKDPLPTPGPMVQLFEQYLEMLLRQRRIAKLQRLKGRLNR